MQIRPRESWRPAGTSTVLGAPNSSPLIFFQIKIVNSFYSTIKHENKSFSISTELCLPLDPFGSVFDEHLVHVLLAHGRVLSDPLSGYASFVFYSISEEITLKFHGKLLIRGVNGNIGPGDAIGGWPV